MISPNCVCVSAVHVKASELHCTAAMSITQGWLPVCFHSTARAVLSKTRPFYVLPCLFCAIVWPHLEFAIDAPTLRACNMASEGPPSRAIWGKASSWPHSGLESLTQAQLTEHTYRLLQGSSRLRRRSGAFSLCVVKYWNRLPAPLVVSPSVSIF